MKALDLRCLETLAEVILPIVTACCFKKKVGEAEAEDVYPGQHIGLAKQTAVHGPNPMSAPVLELILINRLKVSGSQTSHKDINTLT